MAVHLGSQCNRLLVCTDAEMEETVDHRALGVNMEIMLESDEEDASLIEEMEKDEWEKNGRKLETKVPNEAISCIGNEEKVNVYKEGLYVDDIYGSVSMDYNEDEEDLSCSSDDFEFVSVSHGSKKCDLNFEEGSILPFGQDCAGVEYSMDGVQILRLDMSASEVLFAKSAAALRSRTLKEANRLLEMTGGEPQSPNSAQNDQSNDHLSVYSNKITSNKLRPSQKRKESSIQKNPLVKKTKFCSKDSTTLSDVWIKENWSKFSSVSFLCTFCNINIPFTKNNIEEILAHITPEVCFYHLQDQTITEVLKDFKEIVKMNVRIAKQKNKAKIRFVSSLVCRHCNAVFPFDISVRELIVAHKYKCQYHGKSHYKCFFCRRMVHRSALKRHFKYGARSYCRDSECIILQLMPYTCQTYADRYTPMCVVCSKQQWSFIGQHAYQKTVCKACHDNICSGKTTLLNERDLTCAVCNLKCSKNFATYWASDIESLFIGENCIKALKSPMDSTVYDIINLKRRRVRNLLENGLCSLETGKVDSDQVVSSKEQDEDTFEGSKSKLKICEKYPSSDIGFSCNMKPNDQEVNCSSKKKLIAIETNGDETHTAFNTGDNKEVKQGTIVTGKEKVNNGPVDIGLNSDKGHGNFKRNRAILSFVKEESLLNSGETAKTLQNSSKPSPFAKFSGGFIPLVKSFRFMDKKISPLCATPVEELPGHFSRTSVVASHSKDEVGFHSFSTLFQEGKYVLLLPNEGQKSKSISIPSVTGSKICNPKAVKSNASKHKIPNVQNAKAKNVSKVKKNGFKSIERNSVMSRTGIAKSHIVINSNMQQRDSPSFKSQTNFVPPSREIKSTSGDDGISVVIKTRHFKSTDARVEPIVKSVPEFFQIDNRLKFSQEPYLNQTNCTNIKVEYSSLSGAKLKYGNL